MLKVTIVRNPLERGSWEEHETEDLLALLASRFDTFPANARIYQGDIAKVNDVTPFTEADIERLKTLPGPFVVMIYPGLPALPYIIGAVLAVASYALTPSPPTIAPLPVVAQRNQQTASPNNELSERANRPRINGRIPDIYGQVRSTPDLIAAPYRIFESGREVEYAYMCVGRGEHDVDDIRDGETLCERIAGTSIDVYAPFTSPNSGDDPEVNVGGNVGVRVLNTRRSNSVNGQVLRPPNQAEIDVTNNLTFIYPNIIRYTTTFLATPFASQFTEGDELTIAGATQGAVSSFPGPDGGVAMIGAGGAPGPFDQFGASFAGGGFLWLPVPFGGLAVPPPGFVVGETITIAQNVDATTGSVYHIATDTSQVFGSAANMSGTFEITEIAFHDTGFGAIYMAVLLDNPAGVNANWGLYAGLVTAFGTDGSTGTAMSVTLNGSIPAFDLDGTYTIVTVTGNQITLDDPSSVNADWDILDTITNDASPSLSANLSVSGDRWIGPFILGQEDATAIFCNFVAVNGLYKDDGSDQVPAAVEVLVEITPVDLSDTATGPAQTMPVTLQGSALLKETVATTLQASFLAFTGRCQVRARRNTPADTAFTGTVVDEVRWRDVYSVAPVVQEDFGNVTTVHSRTFATASALALKERKLSMLATRRLPTRIGSGNTFTDSTFTATKRADAIFAAICRDHYIGNRDVAELDVDSIYDTVQAVEDYFGHEFAAEFCYTFDNDNMTFEETANVVASAIFSVAYRRGNVIKLSFEKATEDSTLLFNHRNKVPDTEKRTVSFGYQDDNDGLEYTYVDKADDSIITIFLPESYPAINPKKVESVGIRNHLQSYFHAWRIWNKIRYKNTVAEFDATQEADLLIRNDRILVSDGTRANVQDGQVSEVAALELTLSQTVDLTTYASYVIFLQHIDGTTESIGISAGSADNKVVLDDAPLMSLAVDPEGVTRTKYLIVGADEPGQTAFLVEEKSPARGLVSSVKASNYDARYYEHDLDYINDVIGEDGYGPGGGFVPNTFTPYGLPQVSVQLEDETIESSANAAVYVGLRFEALTGKLFKIVNDTNSTYEEIEIQTWKLIGGNFKIRLTYPSSPNGGPFNVSPPPANDLDYTWLPIVTDDRTWVYRQGVSAPAEYVLVWVVEIGNDAEEVLVTATFTLLAHATA